MQQKSITLSQEHYCLFVCIPHITTSVIFLLSYFLGQKDMALPPARTVPYMPEEK